MTNNKSVVCSDGRKFSGVLEAAKAVKRNPNAIYVAILKTTFNEHYLCAGVQWAYAHSVPKEWLSPSLSPSKPIKKKASRSVICSDGRKFSSVAEAAKAVGQTLQTILNSISSTNRGLYRRCAGVQWAYANLTMLEWPSKKSRPLVCSDGREFSSIAEVIRSTGQTRQAINKAAILTDVGVYHECMGVQWAFDSKPEVWPKKGSK